MSLDGRVAKLEANLDDADAWESQSAILSLERQLLETTRLIARLMVEHDRIALMSMAHMRVHSDTITMKDLFDLVQTLTDAASRAHGRIKESETPLESYEEYRKTLDNHGLEALPRLLDT